MSRARTLGILLCFSGGAFAQSLAPPAFEVATVKPVAVSQGLPPGFSTTPRRTGERLTWTTTRSWLVEYAYHLPSWRVVGVKSEPVFYVVEAKTEATATEDQVRLMLQKLLQDRFKLSVHRETRELQGYELRVAKSEPKIKGVPAQVEAPPLPDYLKGKPTAAFEDRIFVSMEGKGTSALTGRRVSMATLAETLSETIGAFVVDKTGMAGNYYFGFKFLSDINATDVDAPSIFDALQEQLGLKLEKQKGPVEILVVDHMEKVPTED